MKILICTPCAGGQVHYLYAHCLLTEAFNAPDRLQQLERYDLSVNLQGGYSGLGKDRSIMASLALRNGYDKIFFIDADQSWTWPQMKKLIDSPHFITAGMVPLKAHPIQLNFTTQPKDSHFFNEEAGMISPTGIDRWREANPNQDYIQVSAVGTAFMCVDVKALRNIAQASNLVEPFLHKEFDANGVRMVKCWNFFPVGPMENNYYGEDYGFCISAQRAGFPVYVDTSLEIPHHGAFEYTCGQGRGVWRELYRPLAVEKK